MIRFGIQKNEFIKKKQHKDSFYTTMVFLTYLIKIISSNLQKIIKSVFHNQSLIKIFSLLLDRKENLSQAKYTLPRIFYFFNFGRFSKLLIYYFLKPDKENKNWHFSEQKLFPSFYFRSTH